MNKQNRSKSNSLRLSEMIPLLGKNQNLRQKAFLIPGIITVLLAIGLFSAIGHPEVFNFLLASYLTGAAYYFVYRLCGKSKPWWLLLSSAVITIILLATPAFSIFTFVFRHILPGQIPEDRNIGFIPLFINMFFGAGMCEELLKATPVFIALGIGRMLKSPWRERIGVWEPLDGILLAAASATGFTLLETLGQYVPDAISFASSRSGSAGIGELAGLQLLIPRIIGQIAGHMAYSGYFGYFIGLSVLKPSKRWQILAIGFLTASTLHALWNSVHSIWIETVVGVLAYTFLMAAIIKARQLSPNRSQNFATEYLNPQDRIAPLSPPLSPPLAPAQDRSPAPFSLSIQQRLIPLELGTQLQVTEIPGLGAQARGVVAETNSHPQDPNILGLKNCSHQVWTVTLTTGEQTKIDPGRSLRLAAGTKINFGSVTGEIRS
jgi:RsiW-degrading membrane proteinase PrsW (M82 family)